MLTDVWERWNISPSYCVFLCLCMWTRHNATNGSVQTCGCVCVGVCGWYPQQSDAPADCPPLSSLSCCTQCVCLLRRLTAFSTVAPQRPSLLWGVKNFHLCISLDKKKAPSPFEPGCNTGGHCGHASLAIISQILKRVYGEQDLKG